MATSSNISQVIANLQDYFAKFKEKIIDSLHHVNILYYNRIGRKELSGRPGLNMRSGTARTFWAESAASKTGGYEARIWSNAMNNGFNYLMAHQDPQVRNTAWGRPSKPWQLKKRLNIFEDWQGEGGRWYFAQLKEKMAMRGVTYIGG